MELMNSSIWDKLRASVTAHSMITVGDHILVGLSGGADSVCLLIMLCNIRSDYNLTVSAAYIDHGFRPDETPAEIAFCRRLCSRLDAAFETGNIDPASYAKQKGMNKQEAARELRYKALQEIAMERGCAKIALAHNADDQAETVLMRLIRGSGNLGLTGIPPVRKPFIRPLIRITRNEIEDYLKNENAVYVTDSSNIKDDYLRNRIRHHIIPAIKSINRDFTDAITRTTDIISEEERYLEIQVTKTLMRLISRKSDLTIELFLMPMESVDKAILRRVFRRAVSETRGLKGLGHIHIEDLVRLVKSGRSGDRLYLPGSIRAIRAYSTLIITSEKPARLSDYSVPGPGEFVLAEASRILSIKIAARDELEDLGDGKNIACLDADKIRFPLIVRPRRDGDFFYPFGLGKRKKIQDFFTDEKVPRDLRDIVPLIISGNDIALVAGFRVDDRYKVDHNTRKALIVEMSRLKI
jgi:tRNA(Ile)-lysidine synthase